MQGEVPSKLMGAHLQMGHSAVFINASFGCFHKTYLQDLQDLNIGIAHSPGKQFIVGKKG